MGYFGSQFRCFVTCISRQKRNANIYVVLVVLLSSLTDLFDGKIARRFHMVTELGKALIRSLISLRMQHWHLSCNPLSYDVGATALMLVKEVMIMARIPEERRC